jgi:SAM-dependent methyltransferase
MNTINFDGHTYPKLQAEGNAAQYAIPFARNFCIGRGLDIGCMHKEWAFPGAIAIDKDFPDHYDAYNLPPGSFDYIFSSHCLEHLENWVKALDYWTTKIRSGGCLFLYLPHYKQAYWRPWNNKKHLHVLTAEILEDYLNHGSRYKNIITTGYDLNYSFYAVAEKI